MWVCVSLCVCGGEQLAWENATVALEAPTAAQAATPRVHSRAAVTTPPEADARVLGRAVVALLARASWPEVRTGRAQPHHYRN